MDMDRNRLNRIEDKLDKLSELVISLARAEGRLVALEDDVKDMETDMRSVSNRINSMENLVGINSRTVASINKIIWIALTGLLTTFFAYILTATPGG